MTRRKKNIHSFYKHHSKATAMFDIQLLPFFLPSTPNHMNTQGKKHWHAN